ncbi:hypothetical protein QBC46DRAFT_120211 [Diplogelasinospora grovesii]|uniref:Secreted protein n=1 Tax=Diplogelasinospora grovesii TaxID=303347 RepID=A0AAN6S5G6_9PEZI|nr:hypothetical protein QBC46DRAFT_120211 [Diplogelasinospora grovesii]
MMYHALFMSILWSRVFLISRSKLRQAGGNNTKGEDNTKPHCNLTSTRTCSYHTCHYHCRLPADTSRIPKTKSINAILSRLNITKTCLVEECSQCQGHCVAFCKQVMVHQSPRLLVYRVQY